MPTSEQFWIQLSGGTECRLVFIFTTQEGRPEHGVTAHSPRGITKICRLTYEEAEPLRAIFTRDTPCVVSPALLRPASITRASVALLRAKNIRLVNFRGCRGGQGKNWSFVLSWLMHSVGTRLS